MSDDFNHEFDDPSPEANTTAMVLESPDEPNQGETGSNAENNQVPSSEGQVAAISLTIPEVLAGIVAIMIWFGLFSGGIIIGTESYRTVLNQSTAPTEWIGSWFVVCAFWTITNVGLLACVSSYIGAIGRRTRFTSHTDPMQTSFGVSGTNKRGVSTYYLSAIMRGFGIYTLVLAGLLVFATESLTNPKQEMYMRLAPTISIIGLYVGYDPGMFAELLDRVKRFLQTGNGSGAQAS